MQVTLDASCPLSFMIATPTRTINEFLVFITVTVHLVFYARRMREHCRLSACLLRRIGSCVNNHKVGYVQNKQEVMVRLKRGSRGMRIMNRKYITGVWV